MNPIAFCMFLKMWQLWTPRTQAPPPKADE